MRINLARGVSLNRESQLESTDNLGYLVAQSLVWACTDSSYEGITAFFAALLDKETEENRKALLITLGVLFSCPDIKLVEGQLVKALSLILTKIQCGNIPGLLKDSDFWTLLIYFGIHTASSKVS